MDHQPDRGRMTSNSSIIEYLATLQHGRLHGLTRLSDRLRQVEDGHGCCAPSACRVSQTVWLALPCSCSKGRNLRLQLAASETVDSGRIVRRKRQRRWSGTAHRSSRAFQNEAYIADIASHCRSRPAVALDNLENLFAFQSIGCLYMTDGLRRVSTSS